ncbi:MAG: hypothetical protein K2M56_05220 [Muribaculaceae bacterium]|nr:hypothetical protein [Muribaculaceae bacterium]
MRLFIFSILTLLGLSASAAYTQANFAKSSRLATGNWVKIAIDKTGVYEISYEALRNMGFENPEKVGLYGRGGQLIDRNFQGATQIPIYIDDIAPVPIMQDADKIYFFGQGTEELRYQINSVAYDGGAAVQRTSKNIYSNDAFYFLSDSQPPLIMETLSSSDVAVQPEMTSGVGFVYHEEDIYHNLFNTGQLFYGEKMTPSEPRLRFKVQLPGAIPDKRGAIECVAYTDKINGLNVRYGFEEGEDIAITHDQSVKSSDFTPHIPSLCIFTIPSDNPTLYTEIDFAQAGGEELKVANIDYWVISYNREVPTLIAPDGSRMAQDRILFPRITRPNARQIRLSNGLNRKVFDVSDPDTPKQIELIYDGPDGLVKVKNYDNLTPDIVVFDPTMPQMQVKTVETNCGQIKNQNLHNQLLNGADLVVICIPQLRESAERLANIHRTKFDQRVVVATTEECYNEFSGGVPDPMAYRAMVKMAYASDYGCKNLLLMGPLYADFRGIAVDKNPYEGLIAYQSETTSIERGGFNANQFYGMMIDYMGATPLENHKVQVGVGILPVRYPAEAETYCNKLEEYASRTDHAYYLNHFLSIGGVGDADLHTGQVPEVEAFIDNLGNRSVINTMLAIDAYGYQEAHDKFYRMLDEGVNLIVYYGHGGPTRLNHYGNFFNAQDVLKFRNKITPIWGFAGCELSEPDKGVRGMGESMVTATPYGMLGTVLATRETWSSMNLDFFKKFTGHFLRDGGIVNSPNYAKPVSIGEIFAKTMTHSTYTNELAYQLVCDPAVIIPTINRDIKLDSSEPIVKEGQWLELSGSILATDGKSADADFNGEIVVRMMEPAKVIPCPHLVLNAQHEDLPNKDPNLIYADTQVAMGVAKVENGRFSLKIMVPSGVDKFDGSFGRLHLCAYDPSTRMGAAGLDFAEYKSSGASDKNLLEGDTQAPVVERLDYNTDANTLSIRVSDNLALAFDADPLRAPFRLTIDGKEYRQGASIKPVIDPEAMAYEKTISLNDIPEGTHTAKVIVRDAAGNDATAEIVFDYLPSLSRYAIALEQSAVDGEARFVTLNEAPAKADIVILNPDGIVIHRGAFNNGVYEWDGCDNGGNRVAPGLYKAYLIETGDHQRKGHSSLINVPVI